MIFDSIKGTGIEDINSALEGSLTFQPSVPTGEIDIVVSKNWYWFKNLSEVKGGCLEILYKVPEK